MISKIILSDNLGSFKSLSSSSASTKSESLSVTDSLSVFDNSSLNEVRRNGIITSNQSSLNDDDSVISTSDSKNFIK